MEQCLSAGGKEVLIKAVTQAIPTYSMACFRLPRGLCKHIDGLRDFWWDSKEGKRKTCWVTWDDMSMPKGLGSLGFRNIELFNLALLVRQAWRILQDPDTLSARVLKAVNFPTTDVLEAKMSSSPSWVWRGIVDGIQVLCQGLIRRIGLGATTRIWGSPWLPRDSLLQPLHPMKENPLQWVCDLIDQSSQRWNRQMLRVFLPSRLGDH
jgi:hypothetical protein